MKDERKNYDFTSLVSRKGLGSSKWEQMYEWNPNVLDEVIPLSVADMELKNPPEIIEGLKEYLDEVILGYSKAYQNYYSSVISWMLKEHEYKIEQEWIVNTPGVVNALYAAVNSFTEEGDGVIIFRPVYYPFSNAIIQNGRKLVNCPLKEEDGYYSIDYEKFDELSKDEKVKLLVFCSPHNPVGRVWKQEELEKVAEIALKNNIIVVSDEIWSDLILGDNKHIMFGKVNEKLTDERLIICTAPSKTFNIAGLATSNIIIKNKKLREKYCETLQKMRSSSVNVLGYKACEIGYTKCKDWLVELLKVLNTNQQLVHNFFKEKFPKIKAPLIEGTYLQWIDFRALNLSNQELENFMHFEAQFFCDEGYVFGDEGNGYERINLAAPTWVIKKSLARLEIALHKIYR